MVGYLIMVCNAFSSRIVQFDPSSILAASETMYCNDITVNIRQQCAIFNLDRGIYAIFKNPILMGRTLTTVARSSDVHKLMGNEKLSFRKRPVGVHLLPVQVATVQPRSDH